MLLKVEIARGGGFRGYKRRDRAADLLGELRYYRTRQRRLAELLPTRKRVTEDCIPDLPHVRARRIRVMQIQMVLAAAGLRYEHIYNTQKSRSQLELERVYLAPVDYDLAAEHEAQLPPKGVSWNKHKLARYLAATGTEMKS